MFTGIIQNQGRIISREIRGGQIHFVFSLKNKEKRPLQLGESIAVDGVCLTVAGLDRGNFEADVIKETLEATTLGSLQKEMLVNLERALRQGDPLGGHFVSGHVDGRGRIASVTRQGKNSALEIEPPLSLMRLLFPKGSVVLDGISLTVQKCLPRSFTVSLVPHTLKETTLGIKKPGDAVNLEADILIRYLERMIQQKKSKAGASLTVASLKKKGF